MARSIGWILLLGLSGCAVPGGGSWESGTARAARYDFDWRLSGDPAVAPLQVFASDAQVWLQFGAGQDVPAIFGSTAQGDVPLAYRRHAPYVVVDGAWQALAFRGGRYVARAVRGPVAQGAAPGIGVSGVGALPQPPVAAPHAVPTAQVAAAPSASVVAPAAGPAPGAGRSVPVPSVSAAQNQTRTSSAPFRAASPDATLRAVLARWAAASGWTFQPQHWAVDVDIPLAGSAEFGGDFKQAVRELLETTELGERPVQPCFYANRVLRVVPYTQACDRSAVPGAAS